MPGGVSPRKSHRATSHEAHAPSLWDSCIGGGGYLAGSTRSGGFERDSRARTGYPHLHEHLPAEIITERFVDVRQWILPGATAHVVGQAMVIDGLSSRSITKSTNAKGGLIAT